MRLVCSVFFVAVLIFSNSAFANPCPDSGIKDLIRKLDKSKIASVLTLSKEIKSYFKGKRYECVEPLIIDFITFYHQSTKEFTKANDVWSLPYSIPDEKEAELTSRIKIVGWELKSGEGSYYIGAQGGWISKEFEQILNKSWKDFFAIRDVEIKEGFAEDSSLIISWEEVGDRIIKWEKFMAQYPRFPLVKSIDRRYNDYVKSLLSGVGSNSPTYNWSDKKLLPEVKKEYERFIKVNTTSKYHQVFKDYYELLSRNNFIVDKKAHSFLKKEGIINY